MQNNKTYNLIAKLCPNGVEFKALGKVIVSLKTGLNPRKNFILNTPDAQNYYVTVRELTGLNVKFLDKTDRVNDEGLRLINNRSNLEVGDVLFSGTGTVGRTALVKEAPKDWNVKEGIYIIKPIHSVINSMFLLYYLNSAQASNEYSKKIVGSPVISLPMGDLKKIKIPIPPLAVQQEIVKILDTFTELEAAPEAELEARKKQYEHYRDEMLSFGNEVEVKELIEIAKIKRGIRVVRNQLEEIGEYPVYQNSMKPLGYFDKSNNQADTTFVITAGAAGEVGYSSINFWAADDCFALICPVNLQSKFLYYFLKTQQDFLFSRVRRASVPRLSRTVIEKIKIPIPPLAEQARIVATLDKFDALVNDISIGLPAELKARRQQYEYYREKLLTFKEN